MWLQKLCTHAHAMVRVGVRVCVCVYQCVCIRVYQCVCVCVELVGVWVGGHRRRLGLGLKLGDIMGIVIKC